MTPGPTARAPRSSRRTTMRPGRGDRYSSRMAGVAQAILIGLALAASCNPGRDTSAAGEAASTAAGFPSSAGYGAIPAERRTTWNPGLAAVGGIPRRVAVCATLDPGGGDDTAAI